MNLVILKGNLARDPEIREVESRGRKTKVANFTIAVSRYFTRANGDKDKDTTFIDCEAWDTGAESIQKLLSKGDPVLLNGSIKIESWEVDGTRRYRTKVRVSNFERLYRATRTEDGEEVSSDDTPDEPVTADNTGTPGDDNIPF